jgi:malate dehydrogenase
VALLVESIVRNQRHVYPCSVYLEGEYGQSDICLGVPVEIGRTGWTRIVDYKLTAEEQDLFRKSGDAVRNMNDVLSTLSL